MLILRIDFEDIVLQKEIVLFKNRGSEMIDSSAFRTFHALTARFECLVRFVALFTCTLIRDFLV